MWSVFLALVGTVALGGGLFFLLRRVHSFPRRSLAFSLAQRIRPAVTVVFDDGRREKAGASKSTMLPQVVEGVDLAYCLDLACNAVIACLAICGTGQYLLLPVTLAESRLGALMAHTFHATGAFLFVYNMAAGISILPSPLWRLSTILFIPLAMWLLLLLILALCKINLTLVFLDALYSFFLPANLTQL
eukprot:Protomagalhaensia_sp_Gyna_25__4187@NODE_37_length_6764_cov_11_327881_g26_i0_p4_GENE_NODE_37_length_6764_cov_11_327881_g26_i0NODE_37_length_6764_cov_11_327881_g26_i0_p4_ORF_typecomplete_len189_score23_32UNC50/PF05216_13/5_8e13DUF1726/PF08351_11/0_038_NODE_37_length_6764_cov_11_327881_g26_i0314880